MTYLTHTKVGNLKFVYITWGFLFFTTDTGVELRKCVVFTFYVLSIKEHSYQSSKSSYSSTVVNKFRCDRCVIFLKFSSSTLYCFSRLDLIAASAASTLLRIFNFPNKLDVCLFKLDLSSVAYPILLYFTFFGSLLVACAEFLFLPAFFPFLRL